MRRAIHTLELSRTRPFDERLWPTNLALVLLAAAVAVPVIQQGNFDDPRPWLNGWVRLITWGATCVGLAWALRATDVKARRRIQFCVLLSLVAHVALVVTLDRVQLQFVTERPPPAEVAPVDAPPSERQVRVVVVVPPQPDDQPEQFERPVPTSAPQLSTTEQVHRLHESPDVEAELPQEAEALAAAAPAPQPRRQVEVSDSMAYRAELAGEKSRRVTVAEAPPVIATAQAPSQLAAVTPPPSEPADPADRLEQAANQLRRRQAAAPELSDEALESLAEQVELRAVELQAQQQGVAQVPKLARSPSQTPTRRPLELAPAPQQEAITSLRSEQATMRGQRRIDSLPASLARIDTGAPDLVAAEGDADETAISAPPAEVARRPGEAGAQPDVADSFARPRAPRAQGGAAALATRDAAPVAAQSTARAGDGDDSSSAAAPQNIAGELKVARATAGDPGESTSPLGALTTAAPGPVGPRTVPRRQLAAMLPGAHSIGGGEARRGTRGPPPAASITAPTATPATTAAPASTTGDERQVATNKPAERRSSFSGGGATIELKRAPAPGAFEVDAPDGVGGLATSPARTAGLPDRRARARMEVAHLIPDRTLHKRGGGRPTIDGSARKPAPAFSQRALRQERLQAGGQGTPTARTEAAIERGLEFLARAQRSDGSWALEYLGENIDPPEARPPTIRADAAATGLALLAFLGAGYDHFDDQYQDEIRQGINYLVRSQADNGMIFPNTDQAAAQVTRFYSHGIAALALCEAFGMTGDPDLREPAQRALDYISRTQHPERGGWRYTPGLNSDLSVSGWQLMALRSGQLAGLNVRPVTYRRIRQLLESCRELDGQRVRFCYNPWASATDVRTRHGRQPSTVMTGVGLLMQLYLGSNRDDQRMRLGADHLLSNLPRIGSSARLAPTSTLGNPLRDTYYWYYATQVMFHMGGDYWQAWNDHLHPLLVDSQVLAGPVAGSWDPRSPVPDKWASYAGRIYVTTLNLLSLEVYYRHLPLYEMTAQ